MRYFAFLFAATLLAAESFSPADVEVLGDLDYGQTSKPLTCSGKQQKHCALLFNGLSGDRVEVTAQSGGSAPFVAIADGRLQELAHGTGKVTATLPEVNDKLATYYIVFRDSMANPDGKPGTFTIALGKAK